MTVRPRVTLVVNPASNKGSAAKVGQLVAQRLEQSTRLRVLSGSSQAESVSLLAGAAEDADAVLVCGGDGIAHLAVNALAEGDVPLGIVPAGSGNDTAAALGMPADPVRAAEALLAALLAGSVHRIDLGRIELAGTDIAPVAPRATARWWVTMLYAGFDAAVNERANLLRWPHGPRRYDLAIAAELFGLRPRQVVLGLDGERRELPITLVAIGNGPRYGGGKLMTPRARMDDGYFDVTVVGPVSRRTLAMLAPKLPTAGHIGHPAVSEHRARTVSLDAGEDADGARPGGRRPVLAYADGERIGPLPLITSCVPGALPVLVPPAGPVPGLTGGRPRSAEQPGPHSSGTMGW